jgi:pimeloyl-ACP methyl ester carboxylesterase
MNQPSGDMKAMTAMTQPRPVPEDGFWWSDDGLRLHYHDYPGPADRPAIVCVPGLTRNARDFAALAAHLAGRWRVIAVDLRGRGESAYAKFPMSYAPFQYRRDLDALFAALGLERCVMIGSSLGGVLTMMTALARPGFLAGALLNDVGPQIEAAGLQRIARYVGKSGAWPSWVHAARAAAELHTPAHPDYDLVQWIAFAKRLNRLTPQGRIVPDYDMRIAEPMRHPAEPVDLWPALDALRDIPVCILRGALSDILSADTAHRMTERLPLARLITVPRQGHPPELDEPESLAAIDRLLAAVAA